MVAVDYSKCASCERGHYFCACAEPEVAAQMSRDLEVVRTEIVAERSPAIRYPLASVNYGQAEIGAVLSTLKEGRTTCGPRVARFEELFARYVGRQHGVMVNSGSSADLLVAYGLGPPKGEQNEILVPAVTWPTQVWSCIQAGYRVRLVDVDPTTLQFSPRDLVRKINAYTRAIFPVHVLGAVGDMDELMSTAREVKVDVIEDCCEALGSTWRGKHVGTFGQAAAFSFFFSHVLNTMEGGMVVTDMPDLARNTRLWRTHGWEPVADRYFNFPTWGFNLRPTELQGAFGLEQLARLDQFRIHRAANAARLRAGLPEPLSNIQVLTQCEPTWHGFPMMLAPQYSRAALTAHLSELGIESRPIIAGNLARQPGIKADERIICGDLPGADAVHTQGLYIGVASYDDPEGTVYVLDALRAFVSRL